MQPPPANASLEKLGDEHEAIGAAVHAIRHLANGYAIPDDVCNTYVVTYRKLKEFEDDLHKHVHLENNILFLKAAQLQQATPNHLFVSNLAISSIVSGSARKSASCSGNSPRQ